MRIVHFSDWHGATTKLPEADVYVCTGDMLLNHPVLDTVPGPTAGSYRIDPLRERYQQGRALARWVTRTGGFAPLLGSPDAPVICVRGNHDFDILAPLFVGCGAGAVHELVNNEAVDVRGLRFTGHRGIPFIVGTWNDETPRPDLLDRFRAMPRADVYVTHYPPGGILDGHSSQRFGLESASNELVYRDHQGSRALHCFGHIHESGGQVLDHGDVTFSNAATTFNVLEGDATTGWTRVP